MWKNLKVTFHYVYKQQFEIGSHETKLFSTISTVFSQEVTEQSRVEPDRVITGYLYIFSGV